MLQAKNIETDNYSCSLPFTRIRSAAGIGSGNYEYLLEVLLYSGGNCIQRLLVRHPHSHRYTKSLLYSKLQHVKGPCETRKVQPLEANPLYTMSTVGDTEDKMNQGRRSAITMLFLLLLYPLRLSQLISLQRAAAFLR